MRKGSANSTSSRWNADASDLTLSWLSKFSKVNLTLTRLTSSSAHPEQGYERTNTDSFKDQAVFDAGVVPSQFESWNTGTDLRHTLSCHHQYLSSKNSWTVNGPTFCVQHLCNFCSHLLKFFIRLPQTIYVSLTPKVWPAYVIITGPRDYSYH